jgi:hypothetical protein
MRSTAHGRHGYGTLNARGTLVHKAAILGGPCAIYTLFDVPDVNRITHVSNLPGAPTSQIDFILCPLPRVRRCRAASSRHESILNTDHIPVVADFPWQHPQLRRGNAKPPRVDWHRIRRLPDTHFRKLRQKYEQRLQAVLTDLAQDSLDSPAAIDAAWHQLKATVQKAAAETLPQTPTARREARFITEEIAQLHNDLGFYKSSRATTVVICGGEHPRTTHINFLRERLQRTIRSARHEYIQRQCILAKETMRRHDLRGFYRITTTLFRAQSISLSRLSCCQSVALF